MTHCCLIHDIKGAHFNDISVLIWMTNGLQSMRSSSSLRRNRSRSWNWSYSGNPWELELELELELKSDQIRVGFGQLTVYGAGLHPRHPLGHNGYITPTVLGIHMWAKWLHNPAVMALREAGRAQNGHMAHSLFVYSLFVGGKCPNVEM